MSFPENAWQKYYDAECKEQAQGKIDAGEIVYGRDVYSSPEVLRQEETKHYSLRWLVKEFKEEYNVFLEKTFNGKQKVSFASSFKWKESAIKFALEMLLISNGTITRTKGVW